MHDTREMLADFFGCAFLVVGILIMFLSGGCTLFFLSVDTKARGWQDVMIPVVVGGVPMLLGLGLFIAGLVLSDPDRKRSKPLPSSDGMGPEV